ncbi:uncharacterized protein LOC132547583 [Ylistrum balloti]|uniref:uncharacterized protein LOC132547583 n=1 Tax=Ylistrum balloti TaxID=509963 RepID=UPI002905A813|nr:uncharacterized protein LOC132547583 [Ylistrum balloti]
MLIHVFATVCYLLILNVGPGSAETVCDSYGAIQQLQCLGMRGPTEEELSQAFNGEYFTRDGVEMLLHVWCSSLLQYRHCISTNTKQCTNVEELQQLSLENGGLCTADGSVDPQVQPYVQRYTQAAIMGDCAEFWGNLFASCYPRGNSEIPDRPDPSLNIAQGIAWWTRTRTDTIRCIVDKETPPLPDSCVGTSSTDAKIFAILDNLWSEPYGVGAHVDISAFIDQL